MTEQKFMPNPNSIRVMPLHAIDTAVLLIAYIKTVAELKKRGVEVGGTMPIHDAVIGSPEFMEVYRRMYNEAAIDVATGFVTALGQPETFGRTYQCCGPQTFSYDQVLDLIAQALGQVAGSRKIHQPLWLMKPIVALLQAIPRFPITSDQLQMLLEGNICTDKSWQNDFSLELHEFSSSIKAYLKA